MEGTYLSSGDLGDIIYSLPAVAHTGGGTYFLADRPWTKAIIPRIPLIKPLLDCQPYIKECRKHEGEHVQYDFSTFRNGGIPWGKTLAELQAKWIRSGTPNFAQKWLYVDPDTRSKGKIVVARSPRYNNHFFPWEKLVDELGDQMVFVGVDHEYRDFCQSFGDIPRIHCQNMLEVAQVIEGGELFIGNQSSPYSIAEGLKKASILEVCLWVPDCIFQRENAIFCFDGELSFDFHNKKFHADAYIPPRNIPKQVAPPGGWRYQPFEKEHRSHSKPFVIFRCKTEYVQRGITVPADLEGRIEEYSLRESPNWGMPKWSVGQVDSIQKLKQMV